VSWTSVLRNRQPSGLVSCAACATPEGVMEQEGAYLAVLPTAVPYRVALLSADGTYIASLARPARP
jgi:hypothetical protein